MRCAYGRALLATGATAQGMAEISKAILTARTSYEPLHLAFALYQKGLMQLHLSQWESADSNFAEALKLAEQHGLHPLMENARLGLVMALQNAEAS